MTVKSQEGASAKTDIANEVNAANNKGAAPTPPPQQPNATVGSTSTPRAYGFRDLALNYGLTNQMGIEANAYVDAIADQLRRNTELKITHTPVTNQYFSGVLFHTEDQVYNVLLIFNETYQGGSVIPAVGYLNDIARTMSESGRKLLDSYTIVPADYPRARQMADFIAGTIISKTNPLINNMTLNEFRDQYRINTNVNECRRYIDQWNPVSNRPRTDIGFVLEVKPKQPQAVLQTNLPMEQQWIPVLAVSGYTKFFDIRSGAQYGTITQGSKTICPIVTISSIFCPLGHEGLVALALPIAVEAFIKYWGWRQPYMKFSKDDVNLGNLIIDAENDTPAFVENVQDLDQLQMQYLMDPYLAVDVTDGRPRIAGVQSMVYTPENFQKNMNRFFGMPEDDRSLPSPVYHRFQEIAGVLTDSGADSRSVDYLSLLANKFSHTDVAHFLWNPPADKPNKRSEEIAAIYPDYRALYINHNVIINSEWVNAVAARTTKTMQLAFDHAGSFTNNDVSAFIGGSGSNFSGMAVMGGAPGAVGAVNYNPYPGLM